MSSFDDDAAFDRALSLFNQGVPHQMSSEDVCSQLELELLAAGGPGAVREAQLQAKVTALQQARVALAVDHIRYERCKPAICSVKCSFHIPTNPVGLELENVMLLCCAHCHSTVQYAVPLLNAAVCVCIPLLTFFLPHSFLKEQKGLL